MTRPTDPVGRSLGTTAGTAFAAALGMTAAALGVLAAEAVQTRRRIGPRRTVPPYHDGRYGGMRGISLRLAMLGDSGAAGLGAQFPGDTIGAALAEGVSQAARRPVVFTNHAVVGARTSHLDTQVDRALSAPPHVAVIMIGANDVTHLVPTRRSQRLLLAAVERLRERDIQVVVGTCPDLGTVKPMPQPLRWVARRWSRRLAARQALATVAAGGRAVALGSLLGPEFDARPEIMFSADRFHPSAEGYAAVADAFLPSVMAALRLGPVGDLLPEPYDPARGGSRTDAGFGAMARAGLGRIGRRLPPAAATAARRGRSAAAGA